MILGFRFASPQALRFHPLRGLEEINHLNLFRDSFSLSFTFAKLFHEGNDKLKFIGH